MRGGGLRCGGVVSGPEVDEMRCMRLVTGRRRG